MLKRASELQKLSNFSSKRMPTQNKSWGSQQLDNVKKNLLQQCDERTAFLQNLPWKTPEERILNIRGLHKAIQFTYSNEMNTEIGFTRGFLKFKSKEDKTEALLFANPQTGMTHGSIHIGSQVINLLDQDPRTILILRKIPSNYNTLEKLRQLEYMKTVVEANFINNEIVENFFRDGKLTKLVEQRKTIPKVVVRFEDYIVATRVKNSIQRGNLYVNGFRIGCDSWSPRSQFEKRLKNYQEMGKVYYNPEDAQKKLTNRQMGTIRANLFKK